MDFEISDAQYAAREVASHVLGAEHSEWQVTWRRLSAAGLVGLTVPASAGGGDLGMLEGAEVLIEVGRTAADLPLLATIATVPTIEASGNALLRDRWLSMLGDGSAVFDLALAEEGVDDPAQCTTLATRTDHGWRLSGRKLAAQFAGAADRVVVPARSRGNTVGLFLVDPSSTGVELVRATLTSGEPAHTIVLNEVGVADADVLAPPPAGAATVAGSFALEMFRQHLLVGLSAMQIGLAEAALRLTAQHVSERVQFGRPLGSFQAVEMRAADAFIDLEAMRWTMYEAAWQLDAGERAAAAVSIAKFWACEGGHRIASTAQHLHGGIGVDLEYALHRYFLRMKTIEFTLGGAEAQLSALWAAGTEMAQL